LFFSNLEGRISSSTAESIASRIIKTVKVDGHLIGKYQVDLLIPRLNHASSPQVIDIYYGPRGAFGSAFTKCAAQQEYLRSVNNPKKTTFGYPDSSSG
jgi:hypothetical protein